MKYNLRNKNEASAARDYLQQLEDSDLMVDITKVSPKRSLSQNSYLHVLLGAFGNHFGYTLSEAKLIYKELNAEIYQYKKKNRTFYISSADLTKEDIAKTIDTLREWSEKAGYALPLATDQAWIQQLENEIERSKRYL